PSRRGHHRQPAHQPLGGAETNRSHPGDAAVLLHGLGHGGGTDGSCRSPQAGHRVSGASGARRGPSRQPRPYDANGANAALAADRHYLAGNRRCTSRTTPSPTILLPTLPPTATIEPDTVAPDPFFFSRSMSITSSR